MKEMKNNWTKIERDSSGAIPDGTLKRLSHLLPIVVYCSESKEYILIDNLVNFDVLYSNSDITHYLVIKSPLIKSRAIHGLMKIPAEALLKVAQEDIECLKAELNAALSEKEVLLQENNTLKETIDKMENTVDPEEVRAVRIQAKAINKANQDFESLRKTTVSQAERIRQLKTTNRELLDRILKLQNQ